MACMARICNARTARLTACGEACGVACDRGTRTAMAGRAMTAAACEVPAGARAGSRFQVAAVAEATPTTENVPAAMSAMALDRLDGIVRCRGKGTFP